jgi:hypothetical protein
MKDSAFNDNLPQTSHTEKLKYQKKFTDDFLKTYLPNHKWVIDIEEQYLLERI